LNSVAEAADPLVYAFPREPFAERAFTMNESSTASVISNVSPAFTILKIGITIALESEAISAPVAEIASITERFINALVAVISPFLPVYFL